MFNLEPLFLRACFLLTSAVFGKSALFKATGMYNLQPQSGISFGRNFNFYRKRPQIDYRHKRNIFCIFKAYTYCVEVINTRPGVFGFINSWSESFEFRPRRTSPGCAQ